MATVFISSTSRDLTEYREAAICVCNQLKLKLIGMEFFEAMAQGATDGSCRKLDDADVYLGIFAHRYGFIEDGYAYSVTEEEYRYAGERGIDRLCFVHDIDHPWRPAHIELDKVDQLTAFMKLVKGQVVGFYGGVDDFKYEVHKALGAWMAEQNLKQKNPGPHLREDSKTVTANHDNPVVLPESGDLGGRCLQQNPENPRSATEFSEEMGETVPSPMTISELRVSLKRLKIFIAVVAVSVACALTASAVVVYMLTNDAVNKETALKGEIATLSASQSASTEQQAAFATEISTLKMNQFTTLVKHINEKGYNPDFSKVTFDLAQLDDGDYLVVCTIDDSSGPYSVKYFITIKNKRVNNLKVLSEVFIVNLGTVHFTADGSYYRNPWKAEEGNHDGKLVPSFATQRAVNIWVWKCWK